MIDQLCNFANDFLASGHSGAIRDREPDFDPETGELRSVTFEAPTRRMRDEPTEVGFIGGDSPLTDTTTLTDDYHAVELDYETGEAVACEHGRWTHLADAHLTEREAHRALYASLDTEGRAWGEAAAMADFRYQRFVRLSHFAEKCQSLATLRKVRSEVWKRYRASIDNCLKVDSWASLYLTKDHCHSLMAYLRQREAEVVKTASANRPSKRQRQQDAADWLKANASKLAE